MATGSTPKIYALLTLAFIFHTASQPVFSQPAHERSIRYFDIKIAGVKIGEVKALQSKHDTITTYSLESNVSIWLLVTVELNHQVVTVYHGDYLYSTSSVSRTSKGDFTSTVLLRNNHYNVNVNSYRYKNYKPIEGMINYNIARLYFDEPKNNQQTLVDAYGVLAIIKEVKSETYEVDCQGHTSKYFYKDGMLVRAILFSGITYEVLPHK